MKFYIFTYIFILSYSTIAQNNFFNNYLNLENKVDSIIETLTIEEKIGQTCQITLDVILMKDSKGNIIEPSKIDTIKLNQAIKSYGVGSVLNVGWHTLNLTEWNHIINNINKPYLNNEVKIPIIYGIDAIHGVNYTVGGTLFPQEIGLAATWNPKLAKQFGEIVAYETRSSGIHWNFSPVLDIGRQPLWSRHFETLGEDPYLASEIGSSIVEGYQGRKKIDSFHVAACLKHFVGYSNPESGRDRTPAWIPEKYLKELYLPPFEKCVNNGALTLMINSGVLNGIPGHTNYKLLTQTLKNEWGFEGFTVSDWEDFIMLNTVHRTAESIQDGIIQAVNAGVDMSMVPNFPNYIEYCELYKDAVNKGEISIERLNDAVKRILKVKLILGLFNENMNQAKTYSKFGSNDFQQVALSSALESITLLKNNNILPLKKENKILISGPTSDNLIYLNGAWTHTWQGQDTSFNTENRNNIYQAFKNQIGDTNCLYSKAVELYLDSNQYEESKFVHLSDFKSKAKIADVIVLCLGETPSTEKPGDIRSLNLSDEQLELAKIAYTYDKPVIIVLTEGRPRIIREITENAAAIIQAYLPGDFGADALVKLIYGEENFSGKLPYTYPRYDGQIEFYDHPRSVDRDKSNNFNAYDPQWDFGFGLNYSTFKYSDLRINKHIISPTDTLEITISIKNTSNIEGKEVVQLFIKDHYSSLVPKGKSLKRFEKINLSPGETKDITFFISVNDLKFVDIKNEWTFEPGTFTIQIEDKEIDFELKN
jgi:beta-glucosidase